MAMTAGFVPAQFGHTQPVGVGDVGGETLGPLVGELEPLGGSQVGVRHLGIVGRSGSTHNSADIFTA
jgi:hypothetical protein